MGGERRSHPVSWRVGQAQDCPFSSVLQRSIFPGGLSERAVGKRGGAPIQPSQWLKEMGGKGREGHPQTVNWTRPSSHSRESHRRIIYSARHDILAPNARTPPAPHEKGAVERQVRTARPHFFPHGLSWAKRTQHVHFKTRTVWQADPEEKPRGFADRSPFDSDKLPPRRH